MIDKYLFLMLLIAANTVGVDIKELQVSYSQPTMEWSDQEPEPIYEDVTLLMKKESGDNWIIKNLNSNKSSGLKIYESEIVFNNKNETSINFDWIDFKEFKFNVVDTLYHAQTGMKQLEVMRNDEQKLMKIRVLDEKAWGTNRISIHYYQ